jgi:hypothetical protein
LGVPLEVGSVELDQLLAEGLGEQQIVDLSAGGESSLIRATPAS